jgi:hypothetical protein
MQEEYFDVNSELYFNEKLNIWLNGLREKDIRLVLEKCFSIPVTDVSGNVYIHPMDSRDSAYIRAIRFDQKIDFSNTLCVIFELKVRTEATPGQLRKYLEYIRDRGYETGYVILLSRNKLAHSKPGYDTLINEYPNLKFTTWDDFEEKLKDLLKTGMLLSPKNHTEKFLSLLEFLTDIEKRSERLIIKPAPPELNIRDHIKSLIPAPNPKMKGKFLVWENREKFWSEFINQTTKQTGRRSFCAFRFDLYEYLIRWAFHVKNVYLDIYEDKNYEYYYNYFIKNIYPQKDELQSAQLSDMYYRFLLIREKEVLRVGMHSVFFKRVGKDWYVYIVHDADQDAQTPYVQFNGYGL